MADLDILSILVIALGLSADCFAVALSGSIGMTTVSLIAILRTALAFGGFQAMMPVIGWLAGRTVVEIIADYDHWVAFALLALVGGRMIWEAFHTSESQRGVDITRGLALLTLAAATSIDALAVGLSLAFLKVNIALACSVIGVIAFGVTIAGFMLGGKLGKLFGKRAKAIGGVVLIGIGIRILLSHLL